MTTTELTNPVHPTDLTGAGTDPADGYDFYREIHKGIRFAMFHHVLEAGRLDVGDADQVDRFLAGHRDLFDLLDLHHHHEDVAIQPLVVAHAPDLAVIVESQHGDVDEAMDHLRGLGARLATVAGPERRVVAHRLYLDLTEITGMYLAHQLVEENAVMPALRAAVPIDELLALDQSIRMSVPPDVMAGVMAFMLPAMNVEERTDMLGGMSMAPPEVFAGFRATAEAVLSADDWTQIATRLGLA